LVKLWLNTKSENNTNEHVGGLVMMHWQCTKAVKGEYLQSYTQWNFHLA